MAEVINEKHPAAADTMGTDTPQSNEHIVLDNDPSPKGKPWMYKTYKFGPIKIPSYASPPFQLALVAFVCFLCPGMFNAVNGLGAGGQVDPYDINNANTAVYATFSVVGFFAGSIANRIGLRMTLGFGGFGYFLYIASILSYNHNKNAGFLIFAGALLGVCAGLLWTAQGAVMMSYPAEKSKGKYISWFWMIFNLGAVIGSLIPLGLNLHSEAGKVSDGTYIAFMILMAIGFFLAFTLADSKYVQRADGSHVVVMKNPTWKSEIKGLFEVLKTDWYIVCLFPMFLASNWFYTYQFQDVNAAYFNIRTRALNNTLYWLSQIIGAYVIGYALDINVRRTMRAKAVWVFLLFITFAIWGGGYAFQKRFTREEAKSKTFVTMDFTHHGYVGPMFLYMFYGLYDAMWQTAVYWLMGSLTNNGRKLANFTGFYKGIQSAGGAIAPAIDNKKVAYMTNLGAAWGLLAGSLIVAAPVIFMKVQDTTSLEEDLKFSDETIEEVAATDVRAAVVAGEKR
jgi:MFS family permease